MQIYECEGTWLVEMWEPVFDLIKEGEPESGHLVTSATKTNHVPVNISFLIPILVLVLVNT